MYNFDYRGNLQCIPPVKAHFLDNKYIEAGDVNGEACLIHQVWLECNVIVSFACMHVIDAPPLLFLSKQSYHL